MGGIEEDEEVEWKGFAEYVSSWCMFDVERKNAYVWAVHEYNKFAYSAYRMYLQ